LRFDGVTAYSLALRPFVKRRQAPVAVNIQHVERHGAPKQASAQPRCGDVNERRPVFSAPATTRPRGSAADESRPLPEGMQQAQAEPEEKRILR